MPFLQLINTLISFYIWLLIISVALSWLLMFNVVNSRNPLVQSIYGFCAGLTEPALRWIRGFIRPINGIDLSPIVFILGLEFVRSCLNWYVAPILVANHL